MTSATPRQQEMYMASCHGKAQFSTRARAKARANDIRQNGGPRFNTYQCPYYTGHWHLGHPPGQATHLRQGRVSSGIPTNAPAALPNSKVYKDNPLCPTPQRIPHPTHAIARQQQQHDLDTYEVELAVYQCRCGAYHLTRTPEIELAYDASTTPENIDRIRHLDRNAMARLADTDAKKSAPLTDRVALRHPDNLTAWRWALKALLREVNTQLAHSAEHGDEWLSRAFSYKTALTTRLAECQALRAIG